MISTGNRTGIVAAAMVLVSSVVSCGGGSGGNGSAGVPSSGAVNPIGGTMNVTTFTLPTGQTRTVTSDLLINATGNIEIDGTLNVSPGVNVALVASGPVTISGSIQPIVSKAARRAVAVGSARSIASRSVTRDDPAGPYVVVCGKGVSIPRNFSDISNFGIGAAPGGTVYIAAATTNDTVTIAGNITTSDGNDGTDSTGTSLLQVATDGQFAGGIQIGTSDAMLKVKEVANKTGAQPAKVAISGELKTGDGGRGGNDLFGLLGSATTISTRPGGGGAGGAISINAFAVDLTGAKIVPGNGGDCGDAGTTAVPVGPNPRKAGPGKFGVSISVLMPNPGSTGKASVSTMPNYTNSANNGNPGNVYLYAGDGGDGAAPAAGFPAVVPGAGGKVVVSGTSISAVSAQNLTIFSKLPVFVISGGAGGNSADRGNPGANGGYIQLATAPSGYFYAVAGFTLNSFGIGGAGYSGCSASPFMGTVGGDAGTVPGQNARVSLVTAGWKLQTAPGQFGDLIPTNPGNMSCSGGTGGSGSNNPAPGKHGVDDLGLNLGTDGAAGPGCSGSGCNGGALASAYTATIISANFAPNAINGRGHVAGTSTDTGHAFFWNGSGTPVDLGTGTATALNDYDVVVGYDGNLPFVWDPKNLRHALALPAGTQSAQALGINANGAIVGGVIASGGPVLSTNYAVEWPSATAAPVPLAGPGGDYFMNQNTGQIATAINDNGVIAGTQGVQLGPVYALRWANSGSSPDVIGYAVGNYTICASTCINSAGDIYGYGSFNGNTATYHALVCKAGSTTPTDISPGFAQKTAVLAVNSAGTPVGFTGERANACVFSGGAVISLSSRVTNLAGISLVQATGINGCGRIIATDLTNAYVLSPN